MCISFFHRSSWGRWRGHLARLAVVAIALISASLPASANLLVNPDFELGNTGFTTDFSFSSGNTVAEGTYDVTTDPSIPSSSARSFGDHTTGSGFMLAMNGTTTATDVAWSQTVSVVGDAGYEFRFWAAFWGGSDPSPQADLEVSVNGLVLGVATVVSDVGIGWVEFVFNWTSPTGTTAANIAITNTSTSIGGNDFALDDLSFVPEPSAVLLFGLGFCGLALPRLR